MKLDVLKKFKDKMKFVINGFVYYILNKNRGKSVFYNFIFSLIMLIFLLLPDYFLMVIGRKNITFNLPIIFFVCLSVFCLSYSNIVVKIIIIIFIAITHISNINYMVFSGSPMSADEIRKGFSFVENSDIIASIGYVWWIEPILFIPLFALVFFIKKKEKLTRKSFILTGALLFGFAWLFNYTKSLSSSDVVPKPTRYTIHNSIRTFCYVLTHLNEQDTVYFPDEYLNATTIKKITTETPRIIVLIWGESTNGSDLSIINKTLEHKTTPMLEKIKEQDTQKQHFLSMPAFAGSVATLSSSPLFFNLINTPTKTFDVVLKQKQNLFKLAKDNGYKTYWLSVQEPNIPEYSGCVSDVVITKYGVNFNKIKEQKEDYLFNIYDKLDLSKGKHFIVLNFYTSHVPYEDNYKLHPEFNVFKVSNKNTQQQNIVNQYHNSIRYLDSSLSKTIDIFKQKGADFIIFTSDHGQIIKIDKKKGLYRFGHNILEKEVGDVPFILWQKQPNRSLLTAFESKKIVSHYEISSFVAKLLGYEVKNNIAKENELFFYGSRTDYDYRMIKYKRENGVLKELWRGNISDYFLFNK